MAPSVPDRLTEFHDALLTTAPSIGPLARSFAPPVLADLHGPSAPLPPGRTAAEAHAIGAALACPGRFWIAASRTTCEYVLDRLVEESRRRNERILVLTATAATANRLAERFAHEGLVRALAPDDTRDELPANIAALTSAALGEGRVNETRHRLNEKIRESAEQLDRWDRVAGVWEQLKALRCECANRDASEDPIRVQERSKAELELPRLRHERRELEPLVAAKNSGNVFSKAYWKATFHAELLRKAEDLEQRIRTAELCLQGSDDTPLPVPRTGPDEFARLCIELKSAGLATPVDPSAAAIAAALGVADGNRQETEATLNFARKTLADLESDPAAQGVLYLNRTAIVVGPRGATGDPAIVRGQFDRCILEGAESVSQLDWEGLTSVNERTILLGDFAPTSDRVHDGWSREHRPQWRRDAGRLVALTADLATQTRCEPLADRPDIELRFGLTASGDYVLGSVAFPPATTVAEAKAFLARDLGEVQLVPFGPARWHAEELVVAWPLLEADDGVWIDVEPGVRERVVSVDGLPATAAASFEATRWTREAAEAWIDAKSESARSRRTAELVAV